MENELLRIQIEITVTRGHSYYPALAERSTTMTGERDVLHSLEVGALAQSMKWYAVNEALAKLVDEPEEADDDEMP